MKQNEYRAFYEALGGQAYMEFEFTANTTAEVNFVLDVLNVAPGQRILDMGCGPGRHAIELARHGFQVTGVDFAQSFIDAGRKLAAQANTQVDFVCQDARDFVRTRSYDAAICLCEGAFGLLESDQDNQRILRNIADSLKPGGIFCLTTLNGYWVIRIMTTENNEDDWFDPLRCTCSDAHEHLGRTYQGIERAYIVPELLKMHTEVGLEVLDVYGGTAGNWGRRPLELDEVEVMLISRKIEPKLPQTHSV